MEIKGIIFDLDGTIYDYNKVHKTAMAELTKYAAKNLSINGAEWENAYNEGRKKIHNTLKGTAAQHNRLLYIQNALELLKINPLKYALNFYEIYWNTFLDNMEFFPGILQTLNWLKENSIKMCICTDLTAHIQYRKIERLKIGHLIDIFVTSEEAGIEKPDSRIFELTLKKSNLSHSSVIFIGDDFNKDVKGSINSGIMPIWFNPEKKLIPEKLESKIYELNNFLDFKDCIKNISEMD